MLGILLYLAAGMCCGFVLRRRKQFTRSADRLMIWCVYGLLFFLGISVGGNETVVGQLGTFGLQGTVLAGGGVAGSVAVVCLLERWVFRGVGEAQPFSTVRQAHGPEPRRGAVTPGRAQRTPTANRRGRRPSPRPRAKTGGAWLKSSLFILASFVAGVLAGWFSLLPGFLLNEDLALYCLYVLLLLVGTGLGSDTRAWAIIRDQRLKVLLVPLAVVVGTFVGVGVCSLVLPGITVRESLAVGAGFGYYSLSSVIIKEVSGPALAVIALLSNIGREVITLVLTPILVKYVGRLAPIASGGATAMDVTLPVITEFSGKDYAMISVVSGLVLSLLVLFLVPVLAPG